MDERANWPTPEEDRVRDGRHLFQNDGAPPFIINPDNKYGRVSAWYGLITIGPGWLQVPADADIARMEGEGGVPC